MRALALLLALAAAPAAAVELAQLRGPWDDGAGNLVEIDQRDGVWRGRLVRVDDATHQFGYRLFQEVLRNIRIDGERISFDYAVRASEVQLAALCGPVFVPFTGRYRTAADGLPSIVGELPRLEFREPWAAGEPCDVKRRNDSRPHQLTSASLAARISGVVIVADEEGWLPGHPLQSSFILLVHGFNLDQEGAPIRIPADGPVSYHTLAQGRAGGTPLTDPELSKHILHTRHRQWEWERERIARAWQRGWTGVKPAAGKPPAGSRPYAVLVRAEIAGPGSASPRVTVRGAATTWTLPPLAFRPRQFCPKLLIASVREDQGYRRWVGWDDIWGGVRLGTVESMLVDSLMHSKETPASRLERQLYDMPQAISEARPSRSVAFACAADGGLDPDKEAELQRAMVAEYYWSRRRLRDGLLLTLQQLAALNRIRAMRCPGSGGEGLGTSPPLASNAVLAGVSCNAFAAAPGVPEICSRLQRECTAADDFSDMVMQADAVFRQWNQVDAALTQRDREYGQMVGTPVYMTAEGADEWVKRKQRLERERPQLRAVRELIDGLSPWISQPVFKAEASAAYARCTANPEAAGCQDLRPVACNAIVKQAGALEERLRGHLERFRQAIDCLEGRGACAMSTDEFRRTVAMAPPMPGLPEPAAGTASEHVIARVMYANSQLEWANNRRNQRKYTDSIDEALNDFYVGVGLTALTFGMGEVALAARGVAAGVTTSASTARTAINLASVLEYGAIGVDVAASAQGIRKALQECSATFGDTSPLQRAPFDTITGPSCTRGEYAGPRITRDNQSCAVNAVLWEVATGLLPILPDAVNRVTDATTLSRARAALKRPLEPREANALVSIFSRPFSAMQADDLAQAIGALRAAGFKDPEILDLLAALRPDLKRVGNTIVTGMRGTPGVHADVRLGGAGHTAWMSNLGGRTRMYMCTTCKPFVEFVEELMENAADPGVRDALARIRESIRNLETANLPEAAFAAEVRRISAELDNVAHRSSSVERALAARRAANPLEEESYLRPGGGRGFMDDYRGGPPTGYGTNTYPPFVGDIERAIELGQLSPTLFARIAGTLDQALYYARLRQLHPNLVRAGDDLRLENMAKALAAEIRQLGGDGLDPQVVELLARRYREALRSGETMAGSAISIVRHADVDLPHTTPALRQRVNSEAYPNPFGSRDGRGDQGFWRKPKLGELVQADHIFPAAGIKNLVGYDQLDWLQRAEVLHNPANIRGLPGNLNQIKGELDADGFRKALANSNLPEKHLSPDYLEWLSNMQSCMQALLQEQIRCLLRAGPGSDYSVCRSPAPSATYKPAPRCR